MYDPVVHRAIVTFVAVLVASCDAEPGAPPMPDAGAADAGAADSGSSASTVAPPALTPCPTGWREVINGDVTTCDPWPEPGRASCTASDEAHFPGESGCTRVGAACPVGNFADDLPATGTVLYVLAGAPAGGDGTRARPFARIADAMALATPATVVALGRGAYDEPVTLRASVTLWGACVARTTVRSTAMADSAGVIEAEGDDGAVRNLRIGVSLRSGVRVVGHRITLEDVVVERTMHAGVVALVGSQIDARSLVVRDTLPSAVGELAMGLDVEAGASVNVTRGAFERNLGIGVLADGSRAALHLEDVAIDDTQSRAGGDLGRGLYVRNGAHAEALRIAVERSREVGVYAANSGTTASLVDAVVRDTRTRASDGAAGHGLDVLFGAEASVRRATLERNHAVGVLMHGADTHARFEDVVIRDTLGRELDGLGGMAFQVDVGAMAELVRGRIERGVTVGFSVFGAMASLEDVEVVDTSALGCAATTCVGRAFGVGIGAYGGSAIVAHRFRVLRATLCGIQLAGESQMDLHQGNVSGCEIGACVQVDGYDLARLSDGVSYTDNARGLETTMLPVPTPEASL